MQDSLNDFKTYLQSFQSEIKGILLDISDIDASETAEGEEANPKARQTLQALLSIFGNGQGG